jgi:hypothetical protein
MTRTMLGVIASLVLGAAACSSVEEEFTYRMEVNGCDTGSHTLASKAAYCSALLDDALNNFCASDERRQKHARECP